MEQGLCLRRDHAVVNLPAAVFNSQRLASSFFSPHNHLVESRTTRRSGYASQGLGSRAQQWLYSRAEVFLVGDSQLRKQKRNPLMYD